MSSGDTEGKSTSRWRKRALAEAIVENVFDFRVCKAGILLNVKLVWYEECDEHFMRARFSPKQ